MYASLRSFKRWSTAMYFLFRLGGCDPASSWTTAISGPLLHSKWAGDCHLGQPYQKQVEGSLIDDVYQSYA